MQRPTTSRAIIRLRRLTWFKGSTAQYNGCGNIPPWAVPAEFRVRANWLCRVRPTSSLTGSAAKILKSCVCFMRRANGPHNFDREPGTEYPLPSSVFPQRASVRMLAGQGFHRCRPVSTFSRRVQRKLLAHSRSKALTNFPETLEYASDSCL